jgi:nickel-dependent lactate racemase
MISLPYGSSSIEIDLSGNDVSEIKPETIKPSMDQTLIVNNALHSIIGKPFRSNFGQTARVAIGINDQSRPIPNHILLPCLLNYLQENGYTEKNITFYIATGTHSPLKPSEFSLILDSGIISKYKIISHDCDDEQNLAYLGQSFTGTTVYVNQQFMDSDIKILVGNIESHHFMGFSGGVKTAGIGLTGRKTITANHSMLSDPNAVMGLFSSNPMRQDVEEIGKMIGIDYVLNIVINDDKEIISAYWGDPTEVMTQGIEYIRKNIQIAFSDNDKDFDLVIASPGGYPKDINFYQAQKALTHACLFSKPGGIIILVAECRDGMGSKKFEEFICSKETFSDVINDFEKMQFEIGPHKAYQLAKQAITHKIILVSSMDENLIIKMHLTPARTLNAAIDLAKESIKENSRIAILPYATHTMPKITEVL